MPGNLEWVNTGRHYVFENINKGYDSLRRYIVGYGADATNHLKDILFRAFIRKDVFEVQSKVKILENTEFPPMTQSSLSFYDDFDILSGIPVFVLRLGGPDDQTAASSSVYSPTGSPPRVDSQCPMLEPSTALKCSCFSNDATMFVTGHQDGTIRVWDAEHGKLKITLSGPHRSPIADVAFYKTSQFLVACDFTGVMTIWDVNDDHREPVVVNCNTNWEKIRMPSVEGHWPKLSGEGGLLVCPVQVVLEKRPGNSVETRNRAEARLFSMDSMRKMEWKGGTFSRVGRDGGVFAHYCILHIFDTRTEGITKLRAFGDFEGRDYCWGSTVELPTLTRLEIPLLADSHDYALSCTEISHDTMGLLIGVSSRPDGHLIVWPDFRSYHKRSYRLKGMVGRWSLCDRYIITWDAPLKNTLITDVGSCRLWDVEAFTEKQTEYTENGADHPTYQADQSLEMACPSGNPIYWCDFVSLAPKTFESPQELGVATCSIGEQVQLVLWDSVQGIPVQTFWPGISRRDIILQTQQAWAAKWVQVKPSWGLNFISTSGDQTKLGFFSVMGNKGIIYDTEKRIERLWMNMANASGTVDEALITHMDMMLSPMGDKFVTLSENAIMIWLPQVLQTQQTRGANWVSLEPSDKELKDGKVRCKFSRDGFSVGLMRLYCTVMDVWNLETGQKIVLRQCNGHGTGSVDRPFVSEDLASDEEASFMGSPLSPVSPTTGVSAEQKGWFCQFCISKTGDQVATCMGDMSVQLWDLTSTEDPVPAQIALLDSRYCAAWAVCFTEGPTGDPDNVVACEDTGCLVWIGLHPRPRFLDRIDAGGKKRCAFSAKGFRAVLMPDDIQVNIWDLIDRVPLFTCTYRIWLGRAGQIPFPHNISMDGKSSLIGLDTGNDPVLCHPETTYLELRAKPDNHKLCLIPQHLTVNEDLSWIVTDEFREFDMDAPKKRRAVQKSRTRDGSRVGSVTSSGSGKDASSSSTFPKRRSSLKVKFSGAEDALPDSIPTAPAPLVEPLTTERYPNIRERLGNDQLWEYLREYIPSQIELQDEFASEKLIVKAIKGEGSTKQLFSPKLSPQRFIVISEDGTKIACMDQDNRLNIWTAHASNGCIPTSHTLLANCPAGDMSFLERELDVFGPGIINYQDRNGLSLLLYAVLKKNVPLLRSLLSWAKRHDLKISLRDELTDQSSGRVLNALNLALGQRSPEVTRSIMKYLLEGVCTEVETSLILKDSLVKLSGVYPSILLRILDNKRIMMRLHELTVPEWAFARSEYKVDAINQLIPTPCRLEDLWVTERLARQEGLFRRPAFKRTSAYACVMPYPNIARVGMDGILRPLLFNRVPHHIFATWPIRCVIKFKWGQYGKRLVVEDCVHYLALLFFFTLYALLLGFLINEEEDDDRIHDADFYKNGTVGVLVICIFLALGTLMRKLNQLHVLWDSAKWRGIWYWFSDYFNLLEILCYICIVFFVPYAHSRSPSSRILATLVAATCILLWAKTLYYAQAFKGTGPLVIMIREIVKDIRFYLFLMFAILMGFAIAFFVLFRNDRFEECLDIDEATGEAVPDEEVVACQDKKADIEEMFGSFDRTLTTMFSMMLGEVSDVASLLFKVESGLRVVGIVMYFSYMLSVAIVLLNLLIAIMGDGFDRVKATDMSYFLKKRAQIIDDMELGLTKDRQDEISRKIGTYLHVLMPKHKSEVHQHTEEWQGRTKDAQHRFKHDVMKIMQQYGDGMKEIIEHVSRLDRKVEDFMHSSHASFAARMTSEPVSTTPSRGHGGGRPMQLPDVSEGSDMDDLFGDDSDGDTV